MTVAHAWVLTSRPKAVPVASDFDLVPIPDRPLEDGEIRVRNRWLSVDPYMRARMNAGHGYMPPFILGEPMTGRALGDVVESRHAGFKPGDVVSHMAGWRDEAIVGSSLDPWRIPFSDVPETAWLNGLGAAGLAAWVGLAVIADARAGETLFVSAAAGAVGSVVVQLAKAWGLRVVASAGGPRKAAWALELGADHSIDYKRDPLLETLGAAAPDGIDIYFDNVGGAHLDAALAVSRRGARVAICGMIDSYNGERPLELRHAGRLIAARIRMEGYLVSDHMGARDRFLAEMIPLVRDGRIRNRETVRQGLAAMPEAFLGLFDGMNIGKMLVEIPWRGDGGAKALP
ncbi:NADP-dependent oxidoreductase [Rhizorhabdus wittichii]|jgi:NADPH-dependent curcumin reductase CurA|uniref:NADP-dependent oxidoreductase n=1 Tax=Rhizorhabdus wittichii TaxID=160791 RepID=A0A975D761_9SPHN|nr:NADP-dependent oxidoreductase [Rhizorhabdus wittichii]QTH23933.1 NADP-dependent oxidoreductase [Rhizorhabdus wittichii]